jgi:hypothetical protein
VLKTKTSKDFASLPHTIAHCAIFRALRPMLNRDANFVACFVVEDPEQLFVYEAAAEKIMFRDRLGAVRHANDKAGVTSFENGKTVNSRVWGDIHNFCQIVFLFVSERDIPL